MGLKELSQMKETMGKHEGESKPAPNPPADGGVMSGDRSIDPRPSNRRRTTALSGGVPDGQKTMPEKQQMTEGVIAEAKAKDVENIREQTVDKGYRHDLVIPGPINIPPSVQQERMKMGQHPITGEPWTRDEEAAYIKMNEDAVENHARVVKESEANVAKTQATQIQPVVHVPISQLTLKQRQAMDASQRRGENPAEQARARDAAAPGKLGERMAMQPSSERVRQFGDDDIDPKIERQEIEGVDEDDENDDPDEVEERLQRDRGKTSTEAEGGGYKVADKESEKGPSSGSDRPSSGQEKQGSQGGQKQGGSQGPSQGGSSGGGSSSGR